MNLSNNDESLDFSIIGKDQGKPKELDFSVRSILEEELEGRSDKQQKQEPLHQQAFRKVSHHPSVTDMGQGSIPDQTFLRDLQKLEKQLSFEAQSYNIYDEINHSAEAVHNNKSKTLSCLALTKEHTNKEESKFLINEYYGLLVLDFTHKHPKRDSERSSLQEGEFKKKTKRKVVDLASPHKPTRTHHPIHPLKSNQFEDLLKPVTPHRSKSSSQKELFHSQRSKHSKLKGKAKEGSSRRNTESITQADQVYSEYYGDSNNLTSNKKETSHSQRGKSKSDKKISLLTNLKSPAKKVNKSKTKDSLLSPRNKDRKKKFK